MHPIIGAMRAELARQGDPKRAPQMAAYMKTEQPFYGVQSKPCQQIFRAARQQHPITSRDEYEAVVRALWRGQYREEMYQALRVAEQTRPFFNIASWPLYEHLVRTAPWWDTLDWVAGGVVSTLMRKSHDARDTIEPRLIAWRTDDRMWVRRASLLAHLKQKSNINLDLMAETVLLLAHEQEFFIRKAIGWVLRDYSYADPLWVDAFVAEHAAVLSALSQREALKANKRRRKQGTL